MWTGIFHYVGGFLKYVAAAIIFVFSVSLSYSFFSLIAPANMPWFVWVALGLTEVGLLIWIAVFRMQYHHDAHKAIAFVMVLVCLVAVLYTDAMELANMFHLTTIVSGLYYYALIVLLLIHFGAFALDEFIKEGEKWNRQHGNLMAYNGNLIATNGTNGGYHNRPLALRNQPKDRDFSQISLGQTAAQPALPKPVNENQSLQEEQPVSLAEVAQGAGAAVKQAVNSITKRVRSSTGSGKTGGRARGKGKINTSSSTSTPDTQKANAQVNAQVQGFDPDDDDDAVVGEVVVAEAEN